MKTLGHYLLVLSLTLVIFKMEKASGEDRFRLTSNNGCICPGHTLTFECTVMRGVGTVWRGSALNCSSSNNEIFLPDSGHGNGLEEPITRCNGAIVGQIVEIENGSYTSQLDVTISSDVIGKSVECAIQNSTQVGSFTVPSFPTTVPPSNLHISHIDIGLIQLTFAWSPVAPDCPTIDYNILASNCGSCLTTTNHTTVTCTDVPTDNSVCTFAVRTVVCGNITGNKSDTISILMLNTRVSNNVTEKTSINVLHFTSIGFLAVSLVVSIVVIVTVIITVLMKIKANSGQRVRALSTDIQIVESIYEDVYAIPSFTTLDFKQNVAYGH